MNRSYKMLSALLLCTLLAFCAAAYAAEVPAEDAAVALPEYTYEVAFENGINAENAEDVDGVRTLGESGLSCGPYIDLMQGAYQVRVTGENLTGMTYDVVSISEDSSYVVYKQSHSDTELTYGFILSAPASNMEVRFFNQGEKPVTLASCVIEATDVAELMAYSMTFGDGVHLQNGEDKDGVRYLYEQGLTYGPYLSLVPGIYDVTITGSNLQWALPKFTNQYGAQSYTLYNLQVTDTYIRYKIQVTELIQEAEITVYNPIPEPIIIESIAIAMQ